MSVYQSIIINELRAKVESLTGRRISDEEYAFYLHEKKIVKSMTYTPLLAEENLV